MTLSIVIPAYNEEMRLPGTLASLAQFFQGSQRLLTLQEVIVVDDGSKDQTAAIAARWTDRLPIRCIRLSHNCGKGAAVRAGVLAARGDCVLSYDADGATPIAEVDHLIIALRDAHADIAVGSRRKGEHPSVVAMQWYRRILSALYYRLCTFLLPGIRDAACGCKLFRKEAARHLFSLQTIHRFAFDLEILSLAQTFGYRIVEVPVQWSAVPKSKVRIVRDGMQMLYHLVKLSLRRLWSSTATVGS